MRQTIILICCIIVFLSCKKTAPRGTEGPAGPVGVTVGEGIITGNVTQFNQFYLSYNFPDKALGQYTTALNTVTVSIDGTTLTTVTDTAGNYTFSNLPESVYDLSFRKTGAGLSKIQQIICPGKGILYRNTTIFDIPAVTFIYGYLHDTLNGGSIVVKLYYTPIQTLMPLTFIAVFGKTANVNIADPDSFQESNTGYFGGQNYGTSGTYFLPYSTTFKTKYPSGTMFYAKVYPISSLVFGYYDYIKNKGVYTNYGSQLPGTFSLTIP